ncbi:MAG: ankyrin repeat domain-containing protein [Chloroflexi bacterium]|nr:ankyrin repeat domain-containing protein [Chloroflexota bacterium]
MKKQPKRPNLVNLIEQRQFVEALAALKNFAPWSREYLDQALIATAATNSLDLLDSLLSAGANSNRADQFGRTALHWAAELANTAIIVHLVGFGAKIQATTNYGYNVLHYAVLARQAGLVERLLGLGADPTAQLSAGRRATWTALHFAYALEDWRCIGLLTPLTPTILPPAADAHRIKGTYDVVMATNDWHTPRPISPMTQRCPACAELMIYNTGHTFDDSGILADRIELYRCANCGEQFWSDSTARRAQPLHPIDTFDFKRGERKILKRR